MKVLDPWERPYYVCLLISSIAVLYNIFMIIGRFAFDFLDDYVLAWLICDYLADIIYIFDIAYQSRKGKFIIFLGLCMYCTVIFLVYTFFA